MNSPGDADVDIVRAAVQSSEMVKSTKILFVHEYTGCDTTSRIFGVGKGEK